VFFINKLPSAKMTEGLTLCRFNRYFSFYKLLTGENPLALADGMKPDGLTVTATPKWRSIS